MAQVTGLDHVQLAMPAGGEDRARAFYGELLGLHEIPKPAALAAAGGCWFAAPGGWQLHLGVEEGFRPANKAHPGLVVDDLTGLAAALARAGHPVTPDTRLARARGFVADPFGNRIELLAAP